MGASFRGRFAVALATTSLVGLAGAAVASSAADSTNERPRAGTTLLPFDAISVSRAGRVVKVVYTSGRGTPLLRTEIKERAGRVWVGLRARKRVPGVPYPDDAFTRCVRVVLREPLAGRTLVDASTGRVPPRRDTADGPLAGASCRTLPHRRL